MWVTDGAEVNNKLIGWVDSDFGSEPATRKSCRLIDVFECRHYFLEITSTRSSYSSSDTAFVVVSQAGQEVVYLLELFADNVSRIL